MFCPECGQERISQETRFCSRCGFLLTGTADLLLTGGAPLQPSVPDSISPRRLGVRRGLFMFLLMFLLAPIVGIISEFGLGIEPWPMGIVVLGLGGGGILRIIYALMFESKFQSSTLHPAAALRHDDQPTLGRFTPNAALPPQRDLSVSEYAAPQTGRWLDTKDLEPTSVTDNTTKLLEKELDPPA